MPSIGPLVVGHVLIVSKRHYVSLAAMPIEAHIDYQDLVERLSGAIKTPVFEAEHGATANDKGGACITHAHVHLIPASAGTTNLFRGDLLSSDLPVLGRFKKLSDIRTVTLPYISARLSRDDIWMYDSTHAPSQFIRRKLAAGLRIENWDWRTAPREDLILETAKFWSKALSL